MKNFQTSILKNGIEQLIYENEEVFKKSLINVLSFKLNENINFLAAETNKGILRKKFKETKATDDVKYFINFLENYNPKVNTKLKLKNDSVINITESQIKEIKCLFDSLSPENREIMAETIFESVSSLEQHLDFYNKTKVLTK